MRIESEMYQTIPPMFHPLRLWNSRSLPVAGTASEKALLTKEKKANPRIFTMRGGYINRADGERRLFIAGKLFRNLE